MFGLSFVFDVISLPWLIFNTIACIIVYQTVLKSWSFFSEKNVKFIRGPPLLGAQWKGFLSLEPFLDTFRSLYDRFPNEKFIGIFDMLGAQKYLIRDPDLIKQITIKDFDHFVNHQFVVHVEQDPLFGRTMFIMRDQRWKDMRATLSPAFTGSKMRLMFSLIGEVSKTFSEYLEKDLRNGAMECDVKELFARYANDAIASCAFGLNVNSLKDPDNEFYKMGFSLSDFSALDTLKFFLFSAAPKMAKFFRVKLFKDKDEKYFRHIVMDTMKYREENNVVRNDMINLLLEVKRGTLSQAVDEPEGDIGFATAQESSTGKLGNQLQKWSDDDLLAQCMIFFLAGFGTVSLTLCFIAHALTVHPEIQEKLYEEIQEIKKELNGKQLTYESIQKMKYLDMVVSESMRIWPQGSFSDRLVNKAYVLEGIDGHQVQLNVGDSVLLPTIGLHMDPQYFPDPEKFDPERFNDENKQNIHPGTYMPFGLGPRSCIASRFALMECKACIFQLVSSFRLEMCEKTQHPIKLKCGTGNVDGEKGFWMRLKLRSE